MPKRLALAALAALIALVAAPQLAVAQPADLVVASVSVPPALMVKQGERSEPIALQDVKVDVRIHGHLSETRMTMRFYNPHDRVLAGDLYFPLPEGATISGYALDVAGKLVDGVVVDKDEARQIFEQEVRKGVDPGLVEWTKGNVFKTRVFPIPAKGSRTISVRYVSDLESRADGVWYRLPLRFKDRVDSFSARVEVTRSAVAPVVASGGALAASFTKWRDGFVAETSAKDAKLTDDLRIRVPVGAVAPVQVERSPDGRTTFLARVTPDLPNGVAPLSPKRVRVIWDASASRRGHDHTRELALLLRYLEGLDAVSVELVALRDVAEPVGVFAAPRQTDALLTAIRALPLDGGTQLGSLGDLADNADLSLLFSDGLSTFGREVPDAARAPIYAINGATAANHELLREVARSAGGAYFNLARTDDAVVLAQIGRPAFSLVSATVQAGDIVELYPRLPEPVTGPVTVSGVLKGARATIELGFGIGRKVTQRVTVEVAAAEAVEGTLLSRFWAQQKLRALLARPAKNADAIKALGKAHGLVTPGTSLLVLETLQQYVEHDVRPPAMLADMRKTWDARKAEQRDEQVAATASKLDSVLEMWKARVAWWEKTYTYPKNFRYGEGSKRKGAVGDTDYDAVMDSEDEVVAYGAGAAAPQVRVMSAGAAPPPLEAPRPEPTDRRESAPEAKKADEKSSGGERPAPQPAIALKKWDPTTPYLTAMKAAPASKRYDVYLTQREAFGASPGFYLDCADLMRKTDPALSLRILSNLAELELESPQLLRVLAHRLAQLEAFDLSVRVFDEVLRLRPEEPQSYRDLALVLARRAGAAKDRDASRADYQRAMQLLSRVVMGEWDRFAEIEVMALTELNHLWPKAFASGVTTWPLDDRLRKHLDMDVRIVMTWDADMTDMDLHVVEPSGEEANYSHNRTRIGGLVSRDFTQGYGPEVYAVRRAMNGMYTIKSKFYGSSAADLIGAVTLSVDVITNYGRKNEQRRSITFRLTETKEMFTIGEIEI